MRDLTKCDEVLSLVLLVRGCAAPNDVVIQDPVQCDLILFGLRRV